MPTLAPSTRFRPILFSSIVLISTGACGGTVSHTSDGEDGGRNGGRAGGASTGAVPGTGAWSGSGAEGGGVIGGNGGEGGIVGTGAMVATGGAWGGGVGVGGGIYPPPPVGGMGGIAGGPNMPPIGECKEEFGSAGPGYCDSQLTCEQGFAFVNCFEEENGRYSCFCEGSHGFGEYTLTGSNVGRACQYVGELCTNGQSFDGELECAPSFTQAGPGYCGIDEECRRSEEVAEGVTVSTRQWNNTYCYSEGNSWACDCTVNNQWMRARIPGQQKNPAVCQTVMDVCKDGPINSMSPLECTQTFQSASVDWCDAQFECSQRAERDGVEFELLTGDSLNCQRTSGNQWSCTCNTAQGGRTFSVAGDSGWSTCLEAGEICHGN